jgi:hypothetical protein
MTQEAVETLVLGYKTIDVLHSLMITSKALQRVAQEHKEPSAADISEGVVVSKRRWRFHALVFSWMAPVLIRMGIHKRTTIRIPMGGRGSYARRSLQEMFQKVRELELSQGISNEQGLKALASFKGWLEELQSYYDKQAIRSLEDSRDTLSLAKAFVPFLQRPALPTQQMGHFYALTERSVYGPDIPLSFLHSPSTFLGLLNIMGYDIVEHLQDGKLDNKTLRDWYSTVKGLSELADSGYTLADKAKAYEEFGASIRPLRDEMSDAQALFFEQLHAFCQKRARSYLEESRDVQGLVKAFDSLLQILPSVHVDALKRFVSESHKVPLYHKVIQTTDEYALLEQMRDCAATIVPTMGNDEQEDPQGFLARYYPKLLERMHSIEAALSHSDNS